MNIDTQDLSSYIPGYDDYVDDTKPVYSTSEYYDMKELLESEIEDKEDEIERLNNIINKFENSLIESDKYINNSIFKEQLKYLQELKGSNGAIPPEVIGTNGENGGLFDYGDR